MKRYPTAIGACLLILALAALSGMRSRQEQGPTPLSDQAVAPPSMLMYWVDRSYGQMKLATMQKKSERGEQYAWLLAELANVNRKHSDNAKYRELSDETSKLSVAAAAAFKESAFDRAKDLARQIDQKCNTCHEQFRDNEESGD